MNQRKYLEKAEKQLGLGPIALARELDTPYETYKAWKNERNKMPGAAKVAIELLKKRDQPGLSEK